VFELQYADDAALPSHTAAGLQRRLDHICEAYQHAGLVVNVKKTEILSQIQQLSTAQPMFTVSSAPLANVQQFTYLGSILTSDCDITHEVNRRIQLASTAFGRLSHRVFFNHNLSISTKVAVYNAMCVSVLLFGCETWTLYRRHLKAWKTTISSLCRKSLVFTDGTKFHMLRYDEGPMSTAWNI